MYQRGDYPEVIGGGTSKTSWFVYLGQRTHPALCCLAGRHETTCHYASDLFIYLTASEDKNFIIIIIILRRAFTTFPGL